MVDFLRCEPWPSPSGKRCPSSVLKGFQKLETSSGRVRCFFDMLPTFCRSSPLSQCFEEHFNFIGEFNFHSFSKFYHIYVQSLTVRENLRFHISLEESRRRDCPNVLHRLSLGAIENLDKNIKFPCVRESWLSVSGWSCCPPLWTQPAGVGRQLVIRDSPFSRSLAV